MSDVDKIRISCPKCHKRLAVKANLAGKRVRCPEKACATPINVPAPAQEIKVAHQRPTAAARWPWFAGGAAALMVVLTCAVGLGIWALNRGDNRAPAPAQPSAGDPGGVIKTDPPTNDGILVSTKTKAFKPGDWFLWKHSIDGGKTSSTTKHTITAADDKTIFYEVESSSSANKSIKKDTGKFPVEQLGKPPIADGDARNEILGKGQETLNIAGKNIACDWLEYKSSEAGDPMKYKINEVTYGETIVTTAKVWYSAQVPALVVKNESRTSYIVAPQVLKKWVPADFTSTYELIDLGSNASVAPNTATTGPPKVVSEANPPLTQFAGEWAELKLGHYLHLDADGFGFGLVRLFGVHTVEMRLRRADGKLILDFPDEVSIGPGRRELRSKPMTVRLTDPATLELSDSTGMLWYRLTKSTVTRKHPKLSDFAGDWKIWSVTAEGKGGKGLSGFERVLKLKSVKLSLAPDGKGNARFISDDKQQGPAADLSIKQVGDEFVLSGLDDKAWGAKFFYIGDKQRVIRLRTQDGATRLYTYTRTDPAEKTPKQDAKEPGPKKDGTPTLPPEVGSLPKPKGPRLKELAKPPAGVLLDGIYLAGPFMRDKRSKEWPQAFPAGTDETCIILVLRGVPMDTQVAVEVASAAGPVRLAPSAARTIRTAAGMDLELTCAPASGVYADGDYTTRVLINRTAVAELNWCVGGKEPSRNVIRLAGTVWQSRFRDGSGFELRFSDGGKLDVHALPGAGKSSWQTKKGTWQQNGAGFSGFADQDGPKRRRIEFRGKLIDGDLGTRIRNENEQGPTSSFGNWYEIPRAKKK